MKRVLVALALVSLAAGCARPGSTAAPAPGGIGSPPPSAGSPSAPSPSGKAAPSPSSKATPSKRATPKPTFADLTQGDSRSVAKLITFDPANSSAVVEPIKFLSDPCPDDPECHLEWDTEESHSKVTVPLADHPKYFDQFDKDGNPCVTEKPDDGGTCPTTEAKFARWAKETPGGMVNLTIKNGEVTRMAQIYTP